MLKLNFTAASDRGLVRGNNEDSAYAGPYLLALADGMGGHAAGEVASQLMITHLMGLDKNPGDNDMLALLGTVSTEANWSISEHIKQHPETDGMGTTLTSMMFNGSQFAVCHAGDSRGYLLRDNKLQQVTKDDTYVQSLVDEGKLDPEDVTSHPQKSLILKAYNGRDVEPTLFLFDAQPGDRILLCSDGLSDPVTASTIETALAAGPIEEVASRLVELALRSGGPDNVTIVLADVVEATEEEIAAAKEQGISNPADADTSKFAATAGISEEQAAAEKAASINPQAILVGAIAGEVPEPTHPDSAASRAAALNRRPQVIEPYSGPTTAKGAPRATLSPTGGNPTNPVNGDSGAAGSADGSSEGATDPADEEPRRPRRRFFGWPLIVSIIVIITLVAGVWFVGKNYLNNNYYVAVADAATADADAGAEEATAVEDESSTPSESTDASDAPEGSEAAEPAGESESADAEAAEVPAGQEITIKQGVDVELFGRSLNQPYQVACLREDGALQLAGASCPSGTQAFTLSDLPPSERSAVGNLEAGSYDEVQSQLTKLSERALPKCRESTTDKDKFRSTPGIDCREVN